MEESLKAFENIVKLSASNIEKVSSKFSETMEKCAKNFQTATERGRTRLAMLPGVVSRFGTVLKNVGKGTAPFLNRALLNFGMRLWNTAGNIGTKFKNLSGNFRFKSSGKENIPENQESNGFLSKIKEKVFNLDNAKKLVQLTIGGAMDEKKLKDMLSARTGGTGVFDTIKKDALKSGQDVNQALQNSLSFLSVTKNPARLSKLNNFSERLNVIGAGGSNPEGAAEAVKSLMTDGDTSA